MVYSEEDKILNGHRDKLIRLVESLKGISPANRTVRSIELVVKNSDGTSQEVTFDTDELDTYLLFATLSEFAQTRAEHLKSKMEENENVRKNLFPG